VVRQYYTVISWFLVLMKLCPLCHKPAQEQLPVSGPLRLIEYVHCSACGPFSISRTVKKTLAEFTTQDDLFLPKIRYYLAIRRSATVLYPRVADNIVDILKTFALPNPQEQLNHLITWLAVRLMAAPGEGVMLRDPSTGLYLTELTASVGVIGYKTMDFLLTEASRLGFITPDTAGRQASMVVQASTNGLKTLHKYPMTLTLEGWAHYDQVKQLAPSSTLGLMAMTSGDLTLDNLFRSVWQPAIKAAGFTLKRLDREPDEDYITPLIEADVRASRFMIADVTYTNLAVYYAAGFARGLNKPVIYMLNTDIMRFEDIHMDIKPFNCIAYADNTLLKASQTLQALIYNQLPEARYAITDSTIAGQYQLPGFSDKGF
jgi:hypothetical protein